MPVEHLSRQVRNQGGKCRRRDISLQDDDVPVIQATQTSINASINFTVVTQIFHPGVFFTPPCSSLQRLFSCDNYSYTRIRLYGRC